MKKKTAILIGAGDRGITYSHIMNKNKERWQIVGVAEPIDCRREFCVENYGIADENAFTTWEPLLEKGKIADLCIIATMDRDHLAPALKAVELGYDILLEKPMCPTADECKILTEAVKKKGVKLIICFVLRYSPFFMALKSLVKQGKVGKIMNVIHVEGVENRHQTHSFVRGKWGNSERSSVMLLQKSSHDIDILQWIIGEKPLKVQSFGHLSHFTAENRPEGAPERCGDGCPHAEACPYNAKKLYWNTENYETAWFRRAAAQNARWQDATEADIDKALAESQYGKCVYACDNDVVDHQVVNLQYTNDVIASFTMSAFNKGGRSIRIMGTRGELSGNAADDFVTLFDFETRQTTKIKCTDAIVVEDITGGHGGGDDGIVNDLYLYLNDAYDGDSFGSIEDSYINHITTFAADYSRILGGETVDIEEFRKKFNL